MLALGLVSLNSLRFMDFLDSGVTAPILLPLSSLLVVMFVGWRLDNSILDRELGYSKKMWIKILVIFLKYIAPFSIIVILLASVMERYFPNLLF